ncbi:MAG: hypothetical protein ACJAZ4_000615 [Neptuniibacter pectenicola]|jgi:hypothetical protein
MMFVLPTVPLNLSSERAKRFLQSDDELSALC